MPDAVYTFISFAIFITILIAILVLVFRTPRQ